MNNSIYEPSIQSKQETGVLSINIHSNKILNYHKHSLWMMVMKINCRKE